MKNNSLYDIEYFQKIRASHENKKKRQNYKRMIGIGIIIIILLYILLPISRINNVEIMGNSVYSNAQVQKQANLYQKQFSLFHPAFLIESKLEKTNLYQSIKVDKKMFGNVRITVKENKLLFYQVENNKTFFYDSKANKLTFDENNTKLYRGQVAELISKLDEDIKARVIKDLALLDESVLTSISQIVHTPKTYDKEYFRFVMNGSKEVYIDSSIKDIVKVGKNYHNFVSNTKFKCSLIEFLDSENKAIVRRCS